MPMTHTTEALGDRESAPSSKQNLQQLGKDFPLKRN